MTAALYLTLMFDVGAQINRLQERHCNSHLAQCSEALMLRRALMLREDEHKVCTKRRDGN